MEEPEKTGKTKSDKDILEEARDRMRKCVDDHKGERTKQKDDLLFSTLEQWPSNIRSMREGDPNGARPCLTIDQINQYIVQVVNDMRQNKPAVKVRPVDDNSDIKTAEVFSGIIRQIEDQSTAQIAYMTSGESAVRVGEGYFRFITEYEDEKSFNQVIRIKRVPDMFCVYLGPHMMPDGSDAEYGFVFEDLPVQTFRRMFPGKKFTSVDFSEVEDLHTYWGEDEKIRVCEYFYYDYENAELVFLQDGRSMLRSEYDKLELKPRVTDSRQTRKRSVKWCKLTAVEVLEKRDWAGKYIPIVKVTGKESWVDGKRVLWGLVRPAKDALRMYNYWASTITERLALSPKVPYIGAKGQFEGNEDRWDKANAVNFAYLEYNPIDVNGTVVPPPQRQQPAPLEVAMIQQLQIIREDVQSSLGMFKASLGKEQPNQSGKAILALTRESDTGTFHFADNLSLSIQHGGRILVDLIPKIYDTPRVLKILGEDGKMQSANLNPDQPAPVQQFQTSDGVQTIYNLGVGTYDVTVTVGPSYNTKRMEAATMFTDLSNSAKDPVSAAVVRYLAIKNSDFNGAEQAAEMMEKLLPPGLVQKEGEVQIPPEVQAQVQQLQQALQMQGQKMQELMSGESQAQAKIAADHDAKMKQLAVDAEVQARELELQRQKVEAEIQLKKLVAEADYDIEQKKLALETDNEKQKMAIDRENEQEKMKGEQEIQQQKLTFEIQCKKQEQEAEAEDKAEPQVVQALTKTLEAVMKALENNQKTMEEVVDKLSKPKNIKLKTDANGMPTGAEVRVLN